MCESCLPTLSKLRDSISGLKADLKQKDKILMDFSTVATNQAKLISHLRTSGVGDRSMTTMDNTTLPWTGSITTETPAPALAESRWHRQGAKPKSSAPSTSYLRPAELLCFIWQDGMEATVSSTPVRLGEPWSVVHRGLGLVHLLLLRLRICHWISGMTS